MSVLRQRLQQKEEELSLEHNKHTDLKKKYEQMRNAVSSQNEQMNGMMERIQNIRRSSVQRSQDTD